MVPVGVLGWRRGCGWPVSGSDWLRTHVASELIQLGAELYYDVIRHF